MKLGIASDVLLLLGCVILILGVACIWWPLGLITSGIALIAAAFFVGVQEAKG